MKIAIVILNVRLGGQIENMLGLKNRLKAKGFSVDLLSPFGINLKDKHSLDSCAHSNIIAKILKIIKFFWWLKNKSQYDIYHVYLPSPTFTFFADYLSLKKNVVVGYEGPTVPFNLGLIKSIKNDFMFYLTRLILNGSWLLKFNRFKPNTYVVSSMYQKKELSFLKKKKIFVIPNFTDIKINNKSKKINKKEFFVGYVGHFFDVKGIDLLIDSFRILSKKKNIKLSIAWSGEGNGKKVIKKLKKEGIMKKIQLLGKVDIKKHLSNLDVLVLPYKFSFGTTVFPSLILEAFALGTPVVTTNIKPNDEIFKHNFWTVSEPDPDLITLNILKLVNNPEKIKQIIKRQRYLLNKMFNPKKIVEKYLEAYGIKNG